MVTYDLASNVCLALPPAPPSPPPTWVEMKPVREPAGTSRNSSSAGRAAVRLRRVIVRMGKSAHPSARGLLLIHFRFNATTPGLRRTSGGTNGDLNLLEVIDGRSYKLQCRSSYRAR